MFQTVFDLGWLDTYQGLIVPRATSAFGIFLLRQFFVTVPRDLDAAARIDGASEATHLLVDQLPLARPALATLAVFHFMYNWNDFLWPLVITTSTDMRTLPAGLTLFAGQFVVEHAVLMAGATIGLAPLAWPSSSPSASSCRALPRLESSNVTEQQPYDAPFVFAVGIEDTNVGWPLAGSPAGLDE